jgi:glucose/arabinose dehydrogenase/mono/diheme cytochrome c family protein
MHKRHPLLAGAFFAFTAVSGPETATATETAACAGDNGGILLHDGFCATVFADGLGHARHLAVAPDGTVYVNTWSSPYYRNDKPPAGGFLLALKDTKGTGQADLVRRFGAEAADGERGGTGLLLYNSYLYAESNDRIIRYAVSGAAPVPAGKPEVVLSGMPMSGDHPMHPFTIDKSGNLFVTMASATNSCQMENRAAQSPGISPCTELETRGGIWRYDANKIDQVFSPKERYATGLRNSEGLDFDSAGRFYATQHGRDQLRENWPQFYSAEQGGELPAEEILIIKEGGEYGWPYCYYDPGQKKLVLAPEYGGDGGKKIGDCGSKLPPVATFPAHWAPNDLKIYKGTQFPAAFREGAFIAFHGSWNRAPGPQGGYNVVFQPLKDGETSGDYIIFADNFAGSVKEPGRAAFRPSGLAVAPDGALFIADDLKGRIWRVTYRGDGTPRGLKSVQARATDDSVAATDAQHLTPPPGFTQDQVALGRRIFHGEAADGTCGGCHGRDATGTPGGPDLSTGSWLWSDGSFDALKDTIVVGVPQPKEHPVAMPPLGGASLSDDELNAVTAYVWALGHSTATR